ncbi:hypothetical protein EC988_007992 [Linderina pennispora]|nr:hypothetical protein EC988_007992 [Linderina pennispora]
MGWVAQIVSDELPGAFVHSVRIGNSENADQNAGFFGNLNTQLGQVCNDLAGIPELHQGVNMIGFSQGGLFLRALVQRCTWLQPKVLLTFGSPHMGVAKVPECTDPSSAMCRWMRQLASKGVYSWYIRDHVVQAQYFKDPARLSQYLQYSIFLPDINNELDEKNEQYKKRLSSLERLVLVQFSEEQMISPPGSAWFGFTDEDGNDIPVQNTTMYKEDWLGLRKLHQANKVEFEMIDGPHMSIAEDVLRGLVSKHFAANKDSQLFRIQ